MSRGAGSGRKALAGLRTAHPLAATLPALYQDDDFLRRLLEGLDQVVAPVLSTLDNLHAYFDPELAPGDFVRWLAGWLDVALREDWSDHRRRALVACAVELYRWEGTVRGLERLAGAYVDGEIDVEDTGGVVWSASPAGALPGDPDAHVRIRIRPAQARQVDAGWLRALLTDAVPAHVRVTVEVAT